ncbi:protein Skeletor, isoforms B/C [Aricia agestis]|uniref:protein Skeletor, isoforms B/C n=1 Tax=Aricia agestis TaxID=91739 RepID=UPI001C20B36B|nr:protein Skeletor, isoforms B/C [Aricia agestis]
MYPICLILLVLVTQECSTQDEEGPYRGKYVGKLNSYHHQVSGEVYAVDDWTLLLVEFNYDGTGDDTFFWAGDSGRPGPLGFIVPDEHGKTNILERYNNAEIRIKLPDGKQVSRITWFAVYDLATQNAFGDVYIPEEFEAPAPRALTPLVAAPGVNITSKPIKFIDASTFVIPEFYYDGLGEEVYFWTGVGPQPSSRGIKIPDEEGYLESLRSYGGESVTLQLPGGRTAFDVNWLAIWDARAQRPLASTLVPDGLSLPPSAARAHPHRAALPHCRQLHRDLHVAWEVFGGQVTLQLAAQIDPDEYIAFGISGSEEGAVMLGADVAVARWDAATQRGLATDYNITALAPCVRVLGRWTGVCRDDLIGGQDNNQVFSAARDAGLTVVTYRRSLQPAEEMDRAWSVDGVWAVWAVGGVDAEGEPAYHRLRGGAKLTLQPPVGRPENDCVPFVIGERAKVPGWDRASLSDPALRVFRFALGPAGGARGLAARRRAAPHLAWYVNGQLAPDIQLRRGLVYTFKVQGGDDPHSATEYHPLVVTAEPRGGLERRADGGAAVRVLAGVRPTRRTRAPTAAGPLCIARPPPAPRPRPPPDTFRAYNRTLAWSCAATAADLVVAPNSSWPDVVYYNSFTHADMGGRIFVVDKPRRGARSAASAPAPALAPPALLLLALLLSH